MPNGNRTLSPKSLLRHLRASVFRTRSSPQTGVELEWMLRQGATSRPLPVDSEEPELGLSSLLAQVGPGTPVLRSPRGMSFGREVPLRANARVLAGAGGQIHYRSGSAEGPIPVLSRTRLQIGRLVHEFSEKGVRSIFQGADPEHRLEEVPRQLHHPAAKLLEASLARSGSGSIELLRASCALTVRLPLGDQRTARLRLTAAERLSPVFGAIFANSPLYLREPTDYVSRRLALVHEARAIRPAVVGYDVAKDPAESLMNYALAQPALMALRDDGDLVGLPGTPPFLEWMEHGHEHGYPTIEDWKVHLSTLSPLVRADGNLQLRVTDSLEPRWLPVPLLLWYALLVWDEPRAWIETLDPDPALYVAAARDGIRNPRLKGLAEVVFERALAILTRRVERGIPATHVEEVRRFRQLHLDRGRMPADDARDRVAARIPLSTSAD